MLLYIITSLVHKMLIEIVTMHKVIITYSEQRLRNDHQWLIVSSTGTLALSLVSVSVGGGCISGGTEN